MSHDFEFRFGRERYFKGRGSAGLIALAMVLATIVAVVVVRTPDRSAVSPSPIPEGEVGAKHRESALGLAGKSSKPTPAGLQPSTSPSRGEKIDYWLSQ